MRVDKYLKLSRIIKRRTIAKEILDVGFVKINGKTAKPSSEIKENDIVECFLGERYLKFRVCSLVISPSKKEASKMFEIIDDTVMKSSPKS